MSNNNIIIKHDVEVASFSGANLKSVESRKALYDGIERDLKAIFREAASGFDLNEGYYLKFGKNADGSWKTDFYVAIDADEAFWKSDLLPKSINIDKWTAIPAVEDLYNSSICARFPSSLNNIFEIEAEVGDRWNKKSKLRVGTEYGGHHYTTNEQRKELEAGREVGDITPLYRAYSSFKQLKGSTEYGHNQIKLDKAYKLFKYYVVQFFARIAELKDGYEKAKALAEPQSEYIAKLDAIAAKQKQLNRDLQVKLNPKFKDDDYIIENVCVGNENIRVRHAELQSPENIDITIQILDLISKLKFSKAD